MVKQNHFVAVLIINEPEVKKQKTDIKGTLDINPHLSKL